MDTSILKLTLLGCIIGSCLVCFGQKSPLARTIDVPLDYHDPHSARAALSFELGAPFDKQKPTIILVADGQQYFVREGTAAQFQQKIFGPDFNVVGLITRGSTPAFVTATLDATSKPDWNRAWHIFNADQWVEDIDSVRRELLGDDGVVMLYGRSGGAYLVHQYLEKHGNHAARVFTQSAVNPFIVRELSLSIDTFWSELGRQNPELQPLLLSALAKMPQDRQKILITLQRQHFYVSADQVNAARDRLIRSLAAGDRSEFDKDLGLYEVDSVAHLQQSNESIPQDVRVLELLYPTGAFSEASGNSVRPLIETQQEFIHPLLDLVAAGRIPPPTFDESPAHELRTEVFVLAGRFDEAVDYRTSISLAYMYPKHFLFIADDNHNFLHMEQSGISNKLIRTFFESGLNGAPFLDALRSAESVRWSERTRGEPQ